MRQPRDVVHVARAQRGELGVAAGPGQGRDVTTFSGAQGHYHGFHYILSTRSLHFTTIFLATFSIPLSAILLLFARDSRRPQSLALETIDTVDFGALDEKVVFGRRGQVPLLRFDCVSLRFLLRL